MHDISDEQILALNAGERFFSESPTKYPEAGHGTHAGAPGVIEFARTILALASEDRAAPSPEASATGAEPVAWLAENQDGSFDAYKDVHSLIDDCRQGFPVYATPTTSTTGKVDASRVCQWTFEHDPTYAWATQCGNLFQITEGTPANNDFRFCCYCGGRIGIPKSAEGEGA
jgi:hypothetical protein